MTGEIGPEYRRLMAEIRSKIASGEYPMGKPIPSTTELKALTGMSIPVVRRAVSQLQSDGVLEGHPGKGVFVKALPEDADRERQDLKALSDVVDGLEQKIRELEDGAGSEYTAELASIREDVGRIEANLIGLYLKTGHDYPQDGANDAAKATARRGRAGR